MKQQTLVFTSFCLALTALIVFGFSQLSGVLNKDYDQILEVKLLKKEVESKKLEVALLQNQIEDLKNSFVASTAAPRTLTADANAFTKLRLESVQQAIRTPASIQPLDLSMQLFARGKDSFLSKNFAESSEIFESLVQRYPLSTLQVEAYFFLAESYFLKRDFRSALRTIDHMMTNYPENDLTGYIMLRMGQISEAQQKADEALQIYKTVQLNFKDLRLLQQAKSLAEAVAVK